MEAAVPQTTEHIATVKNTTYLIICKQESLNAFLKHENAFFLLFKPELQPLEGNVIIQTPARIW